MFLNPRASAEKQAPGELHQQTSSLLAFRSVDKNIFDAQLGFNLLVQYGPAAPLKLAAAERRIERHVEILLAKAVPLPSIRLIQAPVFHAYSLSFWIEFGKDITVDELGHALASAQIAVREAKEEAPNSIAAAGQSGLIACDIRIDRTNPRAAWLWVVCDNLRMTADYAVTLVRSLQTKN